MTDAVLNQEAPELPELPRGALLGVQLCFGLSGTAALIYQTAWTRQFALVFGTSELAVATVLAAYMGGLGLGACLIQRFLGRIRRPVAVYAAFELAIAACALWLIPAGLWLSQHLLVQWFGGQSEPPADRWGGISLYYLAGAFLVLIVPTALMGATLPLLARFAVRTRAQLGTRIGALYACNTAGAVGGALLGALVLLPAWGLKRTQWSAAALNVLVAVLASALGRDGAETPPSMSVPPTGIRDRAGLWVLPLMLLSGAITLLHEVLWTRMLSHLLGGSVAAFGVMLAGFLAGISLGGALGAWLAHARAVAGRALALAELGAALAALGAWVTLSHWLPAGTDLVPKVLYGLALLLPMAFAVGMTYPLAVRVLSDDVASAALASARVYAWNTAGAIVGALLGGFVLIPAWRYEGALLAGVLGSAALATVAAWALRPSSWRFAAAVSMPLLLTAALLRPQAPQLLLQSSPLFARGSGTVLYYDVGRSATVAVLDQEDMLLLRTNGLPESAMTRRGGMPRFNGEMWMPALGVLARPEANDLLIVGYGAGRMVEAVPPSVRRIDVLELEPKVLDANRALQAERNTDPLLDPRVHVILNDARGALALTSRHYQIIISQPSHPWTASASHLYTREYMRQAREHLQSDGVFVQWMNSDFIDEGLLRQLLATLTDVFSHVRVYRTDYNTLVFMGSQGALEPERDLEALQRSLDRSPRHYLRVGIATPEDVLATLVLTDAGARALANGASAITDDRNALAVTRVYDLHRALDPSSLGQLLSTYDPLRDAHSFVYRELQGQMNFEYLARRLNSRVDRDAPRRIDAIADAIADPATAAYIHSVALSARGAPDGQVQEELGRDLQQFPRDDTLRFEYIHPQLGALAFDGAPPAFVTAAAGLGTAPAEVLAVAHAAAHQQWQEVASHDVALAHVPATAPWSAEATQLRVEWRIRVLNEDLRARLCDEALRLVDEAALIQQAPPLRALRAYAGLGLHRADIVVESISNFARVLSDRRGIMTPSERSTLRPLVPALHELLDQVKGDPAVTPARRQTVHDELDRAGADVDPA